MTKMLTPQQAYISPARAFNQKAKQLCATFRKAKGWNAMVSACYSCKLPKCVVPEGNFTTEEIKQFAAARGTLYAEN